jgi:hypothetical protein
LSCVCRNCSVKNAASVRLAVPNHGAVDSEKIGDTKKKKIGKKENVDYALIFSNVLWVRIVLVEVYIFICFSKEYFKIRSDMPFLNDDRRRQYVGSWVGTFLVGIILFFEKAKYFSDNASKIVCTISLLFLRTTTFKFSFQIASLTRVTQIFPKKYYITFSVKK